ncbi:IS21-like element helper ATPase IstB [Micromonospora sp. NBC_00617]|uniref:IS21-like element helper ATPase IstB n=1 Tax=Micromonospora sp. NBC_00617 TaxID=2903587 RepID=UPI0030E4141A
MPARTPAATAPAPLAADLTEALKRLKLSTMRQLAPDVLHTAKIQRWTPEEVLRTLIEAEVAARDESNQRNRLRGAGFPVTKTLEEFKVTASSVPQATFDYLAGLEWIGKAENLCLVGPAGTGKSHLLAALGHAAVAAGHKVRYLTAAELVEQLYRGLADSSVGRVIDTLLRHDLIIVDEVGFAPLDDTGTQLLFRFVAAAYERRALGIASHWPFEQWGRFLPEHVTATSLLDRLLHHATVVVTEGESSRMREARTRTTRSRS